MTSSSVVFCAHGRMALTSLQANMVVDLCISKLSAKSIPSTATISDALQSFRSVENCFVVWTTDNCVWKVCVVDILCYLCIEENLDAPIATLSTPISIMLLYKSATIIRYLEPDSSILETLDAIVNGVRIFLVPIRSKLNELSGGG
ncbi:hypothetical protein ZIOFF_070270 [Zingiber officinale]|uniref:Uncharacterized protein n=1 Tax=Zingiber officinale TaxID=94328 RepID=A0A8J5EDG9_ZINOF|nr:hypothetical protein ZIOFF_070270 [Zingiber officinale]